jgi:hypothetical protein
MTRNDVNQILTGAAVAAMLILPTLAHAGPRALPAPPPAPPAPGVHFIADSGSWVKGTAKSYNVHTVRVEDVVGTLNVKVTSSGPATLQISGVQSRVDQVHVRSDGDTLKIESNHPDGVWNWRDWFNFSIHDKSNPQNLRIALTVPRGTALDVSGLIGDAKIGDTMGRLRFEAVATKAEIGEVKTAKISLAGSGNLTVAKVDGELHMSIAGSGKIRVGSTGPVHADIAGAGDAKLGDIHGGLKLSIAGSGDVAAKSVNGAVKVSIAGSGSVKIADGKADPLHVSIIGSGNVNFGGHAVDPHLTALGSGRVRIKSYSGHLSSTGSMHVQVNGKSVHVNTDDGDSDF